jgi:Icc-related predicted phosphoesterase
VLSSSAAVCCVLGSGLLAQGCSSPPPPRPAPKVEVAVEPEPPDHPAKWADVAGFYGTQCPPPSFTLDEPLQKTVAGQTFTITGTHAARAERQQGPLIIGVLGAVKDAADATRKNLEIAKAAFVAAKVSVVVFNGDVAETAEIHDVAKMIGDVFGDDLPLIVHSGNSEWTSGFTDAFADAEAAHPAFFNMNFIRHLDLGGVHLVSLPGWSVREFVKQGGCHYESKHVEELTTLVNEINAKGEVVVLTAHGPPRGVDATSLDRTFDDGNVGDEDLARLLQSGAVRFGLFGHILEAGGRATADATTHKPLPLPQKKPSSSLFVNVGSASSVGVQLLSKKTSRGIAAIVTIDKLDAGGQATVKFVPLKK